MLKRKPPAQLELFVAGPLEQLVPCDHVLARIDRVLDLGWLHEEVADCYCADNGRPGIDPEVAVRLMLAGFLLGIVHDRRLMREAQVNIAIRWFIGCGLHDRLPDHSSLTRIRQRWGEDRFRTIFQRTVSACLEAGIAKGEVVHVDATLIRADVSWKSMVDRHAEVVAAENGDAADGETESESKTSVTADGERRKADARPAGKRKKVSRTDGESETESETSGAADGESETESETSGAADGESETESESKTSVMADGKRRKADARPAGKRKKVSRTDGDASLAASRRGQSPEPCFKQHTAVDDENGVVLDVAVTTGEVCEGDMIESQVDEVRAATGREIGTVTADSGYAFAKVYGGLERRGIDPLIPAKRDPAKSRVPLRRFRYDAKHDIVKCPRGKVLRPGKPRKRGGRFFHAKATDCARCPLRGDCLSEKSRRRTVVVGDDYPALLRARRRKLRRSDEDRRLCKRHFWRSEGFHGETKTQHGLRRAVRRGLGNMKIQSCLTAAAINLKRLAAAFHARSPASGTIRMREMLVSAVLARWAGRIRCMRAGFA